MTDHRPNAKTSCPDAKHPPLHIRVVEIEPAQTRQPSSNGAGRDRVPTLRVFGVTPGGQKVCVHVHGYYPYLYVRLRDVTGVVAPEDSARNEALRHFQEAVERALRIATSKGAARSRPRRFVHSLQVISAREFYGYHPDAAEFVKIQLLDPRAVSQLAALLRGGCVLEDRLTVFHAHISYILSFLVDHNLAGMGLMRVSAWTFRRPLPPAARLSAERANGVRVWTRDSTPRSLLASRSRERESRCELEADVHCAYILNRDETPTARLTARDQETKFVGSLAPLWRDEERRRENEGLDPPPSMRSLLFAGPSREEPRPPPVPVRDAFSSAREHMATLERSLHHDVNSNSGSGSHERYLTPSGTPPPATPPPATPQPATPRLSQVLLTPTDETARDCLRALLSRTDAKKDENAGIVLDSEADGPNSSGHDNESSSSSADNSGSESDGSLGPVEREVAEILMASQEVSQSRSVSTLGLSKLVSSNAPRRRISKRKTRARTAVASAQLGTNSHSAKEAMVEPQRLVFDPATRKRRRNYNHTDESSSRSKTVPLLPSGSVGFRDSQRSDRLYLSKVIDERRNTSGRTTHFRVRLRRRDSDVANCDDRVVWVRAEKINSRTDLIRAYRAQRVKELNGKCIIDKSAPSGTKTVPLEPAKESATSVPGTTSSSHESSGRLAMDLSLRFTPPSHRPRHQVKVVWAHAPPSSTAIMSSFQCHGLSMVEYESPFMSDPTDRKGRNSVTVQVPNGQFTFKGGPNHAPSLPHFPSRLACVNRSRKRDRPPVILPRAAVPVWVRGGNGSELLDDGTGAIALQKTKISKRRNGKREAFPSHPVFEPDSERLGLGERIVVKRLLVLEPRRLPPTPDSLMATMTDPSSNVKPDHEYVPSDPTGKSPSPRDELQLDRPPSPKYDELYTDLTPLPVQRRAQPRTNAANASPGALSLHAGLTTGGLARSAGFGAACAAETQQSSSGSVREAPRGPAPGFAPAPVVAGAGLNLTVMTLEVWAWPNGNLTPRADKSALAMAAYRVRHYALGAGPTDPSHDICGLLSVGAAGVVRADVGLSGPQDRVLIVESEHELIQRLVDVVQGEDPDMLVGYEVQRLSWGYVKARCHTLGIPFIDHMSRLHIPKQSPHRTHEGSKSDDKKKDSNTIDTVFRAPSGGRSRSSRAALWAQKKTAGFAIAGRIVLNVWQLLRSELRLRHYGIETVALRVLGRPHPVWSPRSLRRVLDADPPRAARALVARLAVVSDVVDRLDLVSRNCELARVFGIRFASVVTRGSQYRVESLLARLAQTQGYILISPSRTGVEDQPAMECVPLVAEPQSGLYTSPVVVLDFQSLYPSIVIAYNICYSTCLGRVPSEPGAFSSPRILGVGHVTLSAARMRTLLRRGDLWVSPNGIAFVRPERRAGVLPRMLSEILGTRVLIKQALKHAKHAARGPDGVDDSQGGSASKSQRNQLFREALCNTLNARQMALKLVANVTYGYTSAGFSGRMPCAEIADAIVETGRRTLEDAIQFVEAHPSWGARVVYGDTDSMFVELKGRTWTEAVKMGAEIAAAVTRRNPAPVKLKFEKVYHPCFLVSKKRYVGHAYETITQTKPRFDAKGIETVRRDSCPLVAKLLRSSVELMFDTLDASAVRMHVQRAFSRVLTHAAPLTDFIFAKEVKPGRYRGRTLPPAAVVARRAASRDPGRMPLYAERVRYIVVEGDAKARLEDLVVGPAEAVLGPRAGALRPNAHYYITRQAVPALLRVLGLAGMRVGLWFDTMRRPRTAMAQGGIADYYKTTHCVACGRAAQRGRLCASCRENPGAAIAQLRQRKLGLESHSRALDALCRRCADVPRLGGLDVRGRAPGLRVPHMGDGGDATLCESLACPVLYQRHHTLLSAAAADAAEAAALGHQQ